MGDEGRHQHRREAPPGNGAILAESAVGSNPWGVAVDGAFLWIADGDSNTLSKRRGMALLPAALQDLRARSSKYFKAPSGFQVGE